MQASAAPRIGALALLAFTLAAGATSQRSEGLVAQKQVGPLVYYTGTVVLTGSVERWTDKETLELTGDKLCFAPEGASALLVPREADARGPWFCFSNKATAARALGFPARTAKTSCGYRAVATVVVGNYVVNRQESEVSDMASLLSVKARGALEAIPCQ